MQQQSSESVIRRLKHARERSGVTLGQLAEKTGYALTTLSGVENGHDYPSNRLLSRWVEALELNELWVKSGHGEMFRAQRTEVSPSSRAQDLAAPLRARIRKARQQAAQLVQELEQIEDQLSD
jgi:transcriptional regulator with XRE-family HTH domain